jgi:hypothetical protein
MKWKMENDRWKMENVFVGGAAERVVYWTRQKLLMNP